MDQLASSVDVVQRVFAFGKMFLDGVGKKCRVITEAQIATRGLADGNFDTRERCS